MNSGGTQTRSTKSCNVFVIILLLGFFSDADQEGERDNVSAACANFDRANGFYEDHSGEDQ